MLHKLISFIYIYPFQLLLCTVEPHNYGHPWDWTSDLYEEVTVLQGLICMVEYNL